MINSLQYGLSGPGSNKSYNANDYGLSSIDYFVIDNRGPGAIIVYSTGTPGGLGTIVGSGQRRVLYFGTDVVTLQLPAGLPGLGAFVTSTQQGSVGYVAFSDTPIDVIDWDRGASFYATVAGPGRIFGAPQIGMDAIRRVVIPQITTSAYQVEVLDSSSNIVITYAGNTAASGLPIIIPGLFNTVLLTSTIANLIFELLSF